MYSIPQRPELCSRKKETQLTNSYIGDFGQEGVIFGSLVGRHVDPTGASHEVPKAVEAGQQADTRIRRQNHGYPVGVPGGSKFPNVRC